MEERESRSGWMKEQRSKVTRWFEDRAWGERWTAPGCLPSSAEPDGKTPGATCPLMFSVGFAPNTDPVMSIKCGRGTRESPPGQAPRGRVLGAALRVGPSLSLGLLPWPLLQASLSLPCSGRCSVGRTALPDVSPRLVRAALVCTACAFLTRLCLRVLDWCPPPTARGGSPASVSPLLLPQTHQEP